MLALVLVDALYLYVVQRIGIHTDAGTIARQHREVFLVEAFDSAPVLLELLVVGEFFQLHELPEVLHPTIADGLADESRQARIGKREPATRRHAVGLVAELLRPHV